MKKKITITFDLDKGSDIIIYHVLTIFNGMKPVGIDTHIKASLLRYFLDHDLIREADNDEKRVN